VPAISDSAIVIRQWDFSETSQTVSMFTRDHGIIRGLAKGARREKGSFSGGLDVLTGGQVVAIVKPGRDLATLTAWQVQQMYPAVRTNLAANRAALYMADLIHHMIIDHDPHPAVFDCFAAALQQLSAEHEIEAALLRFQWLLLRECGYEPVVAHDARTGEALPNDARSLTFSASAGGIVKHEPGVVEQDRPATLSDERESLHQDQGNTPPNQTRSHSDRRESKRNHPSGRVPGKNLSATRSWKVRRETVHLLQALARGDELAPFERATGTRANRLLAAYIRELLGREPASMRWAFSDIVGR
jgi:DNA repair protein RecO